MISSAKGQTTRDKEGLTTTGGTLLGKSLLIAINTQGAADAERGGLFRSGRCPLGRIEGTNRAAEGLFDLLGRGGVDVEIEANGAGGREFPDDQILLPGKPKPLDPGILPFCRGKA